MSLNESEPHQTISCQKSLLTFRRLWFLKSSKVSYFLANELQGRILGRRATALISTAISGCGKPLTSKVVRAGPVAASKNSA